MSTLAEHPPEMTMAADDFQALEERVLRTVELLKGERELRFSVEQHASRLTQRIEEQAAHVAQFEEQLSGLQKERDACGNASSACSNKSTKAIDRRFMARILKSAVPPHPSV